MTRGIAYIGPVALDILDCEFAWNGGGSSAGIRAASLGGSLSWGQAAQLQELVSNPDRRVTLGNNTGVLEFVWSDDAYLATFSGWYLLQSCDIRGGVQHSGPDALVPFSIAGVNLGERQPVIVRSSRALDNDFSLTAREVLAAPFAVSADAAGFNVEPGGTALTRTVDAKHGDGLFPATTDPRDLQLRVANVGTLATVVLPAIDADGTPPLWVTARGGDCRAYDLAEGRAVYGPSHPLAEPSDLIVENGLLRVWVGARGVVPYVTVAAFVDDAWAQCGHVVFADETSGPKLAGVRLVRVTPDVVTAALRVPALGEIFISLRRGERMIRVQHGNTTAPTISATRRIAWLGTPPTVAGIGAAANGTGEFGAGLDVTSAPPSFQWPSAATQEAWSLRMAWVPPHADFAQDFAGLFSLVDADANVLATGYWDADESKIVVAVGGDTLASPALTFAAEDVVTLAVYFDTTSGLGLTVHTDDSGTLTAADASIVAPVSTAAITAIDFTSAALSDTEWGDGVWGDGTWGDAFGPAGVVDELVVFAGRLTAAQAAAVVDQATQLDDVPSDPRPVWYAAFDTAVSPTGVALGTGRRVETTPDANGFSRFVAALETVSSSATFGISKSDTSLVFAAGLGTTGDDAASQHAQLAATSQQETRIR